MGTKSLNKRSSKSKRSISKPDIIMPPSQTSRFTFVKVPLFVLLVMALSVIALLGLSSIMWSALTSTYHSPKLYTIQVLNEFPHDPNAFTQGLLYAGNDTIFESTGLYGQSSVRRVALQSGKVEVLQEMNGSYFGEGLTLLGERLFQVTWLTKTGFIYDRNDLSKIEKFTHQMHDGWGLATDGKILFGSDGTSTLYQIDPQTLKVITKHTVKYENHEVRYLNELEFVNGEVWANVWQTDCIARISHKDGTVVGWILLDNLRKGLVAAGQRLLENCGQSFMKSNCN
ncbi:glutaminyl-peptide cyclotransferase isoform X2 [Hevea brasiliensis]|uniref:glutaminyl-peptide cyclotransferase isoform X2 n=1 Tax=Hevea brasiliensis TaxID=3981 RepID=UPI0025F04029|nr:glutaminyl-peptide cyclotransferase isoform X2 [Hevea brasiliensis]